MTEIQELDVTQIAPRLKHLTIFQTFDKLDDGESFVIKNDHDPRPLRYQFRAERPDQFDWEYLEEGPHTWRVKLTKTAE